MSTKTIQPKKKSTYEIMQEQEIEQLQDRIDHDKESISAMDAARDEMIKGDIVGLAVVHKLFGEGTVIEQAPSTITVKFPFGNKRFIIPSAFTDGFLETTDPTMKEHISEYTALGEQIRNARDDISSANQAIKKLTGQK